MTRSEISRDQSDAAAHKGAKETHMGTKELRFLTSKLPNESWGQFEERVAKLAEERGLTSTQSGEGLDKKEAH